MRRYNYDPYGPRTLAGTRQKFYYMERGRRRYTVGVPNSYLYTDFLSASAQRALRKSGVKIKGRITKPKQVTPVAAREPDRLALELDNTLRGVLPASIRSEVMVAAGDPMMNAELKELMPRASEFRTPETAVLVGIYMNRWLREKVSDEIDSYWRGNSVSNVSREVIVGAGPHAAIYAAVSVRQGKAKPLVLERSRSVGGSFACSKGPSFYLNSRNRPGGDGEPGDNTTSLNYLPGLVVQPSDLSGLDYPTNDQVSWAVKMTLAKYAIVVLETEVKTVRPVGRNGAGFTVDDRDFSAGSLRIATGIGVPNQNWQVASDRLLSFSQLMSRMDSPFPLKGMRRVAVIGAGDSGKTAIEALTGLAPGAGMSVASLDWPVKIDWYGVEAACTTPDGWAARNRSRYKKIAALFKGSPPRVVPLPRRAVAVNAGYETVLVDDTPYDYVIDCTGFRLGAVPVSTTSFDDYAIGAAYGGRYVGRGNTRVLRIGPASGLPFTDTEQSKLANIRENEVALFRYAPRTAAAAMIV